MSARIAIALLLVPLLSGSADAKSKRKQPLTDDILQAETVLVVVRPDAGEPLNNPLANRTAQDDVEKALMKWGRFRLAMESETADLVIAVRKGHESGQTIQNSPTDDRGIIYEPIDGSTRVGVQQGRPPDITNSGIGGPERRRPRISNETGPAEDLFEVYRGGAPHPLDSAPA